jgi:hypothetical protein
MLSTRISQLGITSCIHNDAMGVQLNHFKGVDVEARASEKVELLNSDDNDGLSVSDPDSSSDDDMEIRRRMKRDV